MPTVWILLTCNLRNKKRFERDFLITVFAAILMVIFGLYNINNEPCIDFRSWKVGNQMVEMGMYGNREFLRMYMECEEDLFFTHNDLSLRAFTPEYLARFEEGSVVRNCYPSDKNIFGFPYFGPTFYGMNIECWYLADNTFFNEA